ncbi:hypothetical protein ACFLTX_02305 [Chloroflexota bacterium]
MTKEEQIDNEKIANLAMKAYHEKKFLEAGSLFGQAAEGFLEDGDPLRSAELKNNQSVALLQAGNPQESLQAALGTDKVFFRADDKKRQAMALANIGAAQAELGQKEAAIKAYEESSLILKALGESDIRSDVQRSLSILRVKKREFADAVIEMQDGLMDIEKPTLKQRILKKLLFMRLWK